MNISGIVVVVPPQHLETTIRALNELPGVDVHHSDASTGRIVITQEKESVDEEVEGLNRIKALPNVMMAEMVQHHVEVERQILQTGPMDDPEN